MEQQYKDQFAEYIKQFKRNQHKKGFVASINELTAEALTMVEVDPTVDAPLPKWAKDVMYMPAVSKRTKLMLLRYHDTQIRKHRTALARPTISIPTDGINNNYNNNQEEED